jgi:O-antigen/teichoic acid export membrane protein
VPLVARLRLGWTTVVELVRQSVTVATTLGLVLVGATLLPFFAVSIAGAVVSLVLTVALVRGLMPLRPRFDPREWWRLLRDTVAIAVAIAVNMTYFRIAIVIMSLLATELETGYFATSFRVVEVLLPIPGLVMAGVFPILSRAALGDSERLAYVLRRVLDVALIAGCGLVLGLEVGAPLLIDVLAGDAGKPAVEVLRIQAPALLATFLAAGCGLTLFALHRNRAILVANVAALGLAAGLTWALVPSLGAQGAALAMLVGEWALALAVLVPVVRSMPELELSLGIVVPPLVAVGLAASVLLAPLPVALQTPLALGVYVAVLFRLRAVPPELTRALAPRRPSRAS